MILYFMCSKTSVLIVSFKSGNGISVNTPCQEIYRYLYKYVKFNSYICKVIKF